MKTHNEQLLIFVLDTNMFSEDKTIFGV